MLSLEYQHRQAQLAITLLVPLLFTACSNSGSSAPHPAAMPAVSVSTLTSAPASAAPQAITLQGTPTTMITAGSEYSFLPTISPNSGLVTFAVTGQPAWLHFDPSTGALSGKPGLADEGTSGHITITASNATNSTSLTPFTIRVNAPTASTGSATLSWSAPTENTDGTPVTDLAGYRVYYGTSAGDLNRTLSVAGGASIKVVVDGLSPGKYYFAVIAYTSSGIDSGQSNVADQTI